MVLELFLANGLLDFFRGQGRQGVPLRTAAGFRRGPPRRCAPPLLTWGGERPLLLALALLVVALLALALLVIARLVLALLSARLALALLSAASLRFGFGA